MERMDGMDGMPDIKVITVTLDNDTGEIEVHYEVNNHTDAWTAFGILHGAIAIVRDVLLPPGGDEDELYGELDD